LSRPGSYRKVAENLEIKEVLVGEGERQRRHAVCFNPMEAKRQKAHRETLIKELEAELASPADQSEGYKQAGLCAAHQRTLRATAEGDREGAGH
jgi:hypothetical protein